MQRSVSFRHVLALALFAVAAVVVPVATSSTPASAACTWCAGGEYHPRAPERIFDTRTTWGIVPINDVEPFGAKPLRTASPTVDPTFDIQVLGLGGVPPDGPDVLAVAVSITVIQPTQTGFLGAYATGSPSLNSVVNFGFGQTVPNLTIVRPGNNGKVTIQLHGSAAGTAHVAVDVFGWWSTSGYAATGTVDDGDERGARLEVPATPGRIIDTRDVNSPMGTPGSKPGDPMGPSEYLAVQIRGAKVLGTNTTIVPNSPDVVGVLLNVTAVLPTTTTFMSLVPEAITPMPTTSNLNLVPGQTKANLVIVPVGSDGKVHVFNAKGYTDVAIDVMGVLVDGRSESTRFGRVVPLTAPFRVFDTREAAFGAVPLGPGQAEDWSFSSFSASVNVGGTSVGKQAALIGNLTGSRLTRQYPSVAVTPSFLTACPGTCPLAKNKPTYSNLNSVENGVVANLALVPYGPNYTVRVFNARGYAHYHLDVSAVVLAD